MEQVTGIGGLFFRATRSTSARAMVPRPLGRCAGAVDLRRSPLAARSRPSVFAPFPEATDYFGPDAGKAWMVNFRVRSLDALVAQLRGRLARLYDPEGNPIELWEPKGRGTP